MRQRGVGAWREGAHLWKTTASTVMAASRRKAKAPRMDPITKESRSGSWEDSSPEEGKALHEHVPTYPATHPPTHPPTHSPRSQCSATSSPHLWAGGFWERVQAWRVPGLSHYPTVWPLPSRLPLTLRQCLEIDLPPIGAVACGGPCPHLEAIDVAGAQLRHSCRVGLAGQSEGVGFIFCLGMTATHSLPAGPSSPPRLLPPGLLGSLTFHRASGHLS